MIFNTILTDFFYLQSTFYTHIDVQSLGMLQKGWNI
jgi:hypothetical protein